MNTIPLFPLNTVLFPQGELQLRIFEPRYLDMVREALRNKTPFGICLISRGSEVGTPAECHNIGTLARILDWGKSDNGLLSVTVKGESRFRIMERRILKNLLLEGDVELIDDIDDEELPVEYQLISDLLRRIGDRFKLSHLSEHEKYLDAGWVGCRLAEVLPFELNEKQNLLETDDPVQRLQRIQQMLHFLSADQHKC
jgi:hypothetical protein